MSERVENKKLETIFYTAIRWYIVLWCISRVLLCNIFGPNQAHLSSRLALSHQHQQDSGMVRQQHHIHQTIRQIVLNHRLSSTRWVPLLRLSIPLKLRYREAFFCNKTADFLNMCCRLVRRFFLSDSMHAVDHLLPPHRLVLRLTYCDHGRQVISYPAFNASTVPHKTCGL